MGETRWLRLCLPCTVLACRKLVRLYMSVRWAKPAKKKHRMARVAGAKGLQEILLAVGWLAAVSSLQRPSLNHVEVMADWEGHRLLGVLGFLLGLYSWQSQSRTWVLPGFPPKLLHICPEESSGVNDYGTHRGALFLCPFVEVPSRPLTWNLTEGSWKMFFP